MENKIDRFSLGVPTQIMESDSSVESADTFDNFDSDPITTQGAAIEHEPRDNVEMPVDQTSVMEAEIVMSDMQENLLPDIDVFLFADDNIIEPHSQTTNSVGGTKGESHRQHAEFLDDAIGQTDRAHHLAMAVTSVMIHSRSSLLKKQTSLPALSSNSGPKWEDDIGTGACCDPLNGVACNNGRYCRRHERM